MGFIQKQSEDGTFRIIDGMTGATVFCVGQAAGDYTSAVLTSATVVEPGDGDHAPGDVLTMVGGTSDTNATATVTRTQVVDAQINNAGSGDGTPGEHTFTGTTGQGSKFQVTGTIGENGKLTAGSLTVVDPGSYTTNPSNLNFAPIIGGDLTGASCKIEMGVLAADLTEPGEYSEVPDSPVATTSSGAGSGCKLNADWHFEYPAPMPYFVMPSAGEEPSGPTGSVCWDEDFLYLRTDDDTWKRVALEAVPAPGGQLMSVKAPAKTKKPLHHEPAGGSSAQAREPTHHHDETVPGR